jgi:hypothetical protein
MANIASIVALIRDAILGKDVREALASGIETINTEVENTTQRQTTLEENMAVVEENEVVRINNELGRVEAEDQRVSEVDAIVAAYDAATKANLSVEVSNARTSTVKNKAFGVLDDRLEEIEQDHKTHLAEVISLSQYPLIVPEIDDSGRFLRAIADSISQKKAFRIPADNYDVSLNIFKTTSEVRVSGLTIFGDGNEKSIIHFTPNNIDEILLDLTNVWHSKFSDFKILGDSTNRKGIGIRLGDPIIKDVNHATYNCDFINVYCRDLDIGLETNWGWGNSFINLKTRYCNKGTIAFGGATSFTAYNAEACIEYGFKVRSDDPISTTTVSFNGSLIENNPIGMILDGGNIVMNNAYFESNTTANIKAGTNGTEVDSIIINGLYSGTYNKYEFDKVNILSISGISGYVEHNMFRISNNVKRLDMVEPANTHNQNTQVQTLNSLTKKTPPIIANDFSKLTSFASPQSIDFTDAVKVQTTGTTGSMAILDGKNAIKCVAASAGTFRGAYVTLDFTNRYLKDYRKLKIKTKLYIDTTTFSDITQSRLYTKIRINYLDTSLVAKLKDFYDYNLDDSNNTTYNMRDNHVTHITKLDLIEMIATIADFSSLVNVQIHIYPILNAVGGETFYIEGFELYPNIEVKDILLDSVNVNPFGLPLLISPNGTKYQIQVSDTGTLTAVLVV